MDIQGHGCFKAQILLILQWFVATTSCLQCHFCYDTNVKEDCYITSRSCDPEYVCFIETSQISESASYRYHGDDTLTMYRMGCKHHSLCRDKRTRGPHHYGYAVISFECCCDPLCEMADGVGKGQLDHCPRLWSNNTDRSVHSGSSEVKFRPTEIVLIAICLVCGIFYIY